MEPRHWRFWPKHLPRSLTLPRSTLHGMLEASAARYPDRPFSLFFGGVLRYGAALAQVERLAGHLQQVCGVRRGDRVLLCLQNSPQFPLALFAILRADAVAVPLSPMSVAAELGHYAEDSDARVAIVGQELWPRFAGLGLAHAVVAAYADYADADCDLPAPEAVTAPRQQIDAAGAVRWSEALAAARAPAPSRAQPRDLCLMPYTSGSTGRPKGCMHTHATTLHNVLGAALWESMHQDAVALCTAPMFHVTGLVHSLLASAWSGATLAIQPRWDPWLAARLIERHRCTHWANVPTMVVDLLSHPEALRHDVSSLRCIFGGGAAMPEAIARKLHQVCGIHYMEGYGMTESISQTHINPPREARRPCLGIPTFDTEAGVLDPQRGTPLAPGEAGEIVVRGPQLLIGYWKNDSSFRESWVNVGGRDFFRTGDLGRMDEDGYYFISDRIKRMINAAGYKVWPAEVEAAMYRHPAIQECCVIAAPDARRGETVKAVVVLKAGASAGAQEILDWARGEMAAYKVPRAIEFAPALPRSGTGKIQWRALQEREFAARAGGAA